ncbi:MAG: serine acetyltransferase [Planctomycetales bacterium]|nr:serine acetyltransferase [Planctomycetales bacterium]
MSDPLDEVGLWALIREDLSCHRNDWSRPGFRAIAVCRFGQWRMRIRSKLLRAPFSVLYRAMFRRCRNGYGVELPYSVKLGRRVVIEHQGAIVIHGSAVIGDDCVIRQGVTLGNRYNDRPREAPQLGKGVNVGAGAKLLGGITIGDNAVIGANAVVLNDVAPGDTVVGIPARPLRKKSTGSSPDDIDTEDSFETDTTMA